MTSRARSWLCFIVGAIAACGSHPPPRTPVPDDNPGAGRAVATDPGDGGLTTELIATVGIAPLVIEDVTSLRLTAAERRRAQQVIATWAHASGLLILPPADVEDAIARAAEGLDPTTGKACGPPLDRTYAMERWILPMSARGKITARVDCEEACTLQLEILLFGRGTEFYAAPFDPSQPWEAELERRLPQVKDNGGHERYGHANNPVAMAGVPRRPNASDAYLNEAAFAKRTGDAETKACGTADRPVALLLERDAKAGMRCERAAMPGYVTEYDAKVNACMCALAVKREHADAARSYLVYPPATLPERPRTKNGKDISALIIGGNEYRPSGSAPWFLRDSDSIEHCFVARTEDVEPVEAPATLEFDANGAVAKVTIGDLAGIFRPDERACITKKLMTIRSPCPRRSPEIGTARLTLEIHKP